MSTHANFARIFFRRVLLWLFVLPACVTIRAGTAAPSAPLPLTPLPIEDLFQPSALDEGQLAPDGRRLGAITTNQQDRRSLVVVDLKTGHLSNLLAPDRFDVASFRWLDDERLVFNMTEEKIYSFGLYCAKVGDFRANFPLIHSLGTEIIGLPRARPGHLLVMTHTYRVNQRASENLIELNADWGRSDDHAVAHTYSPPNVGGDIVGMRAGPDGELALCAAFFSGRFHLYRYLRESRSWRPIKLDSSSTEPMTVDLDGQSLWLVTHEAATGYELRRYEFATEKLEAPVLSDPEYNLADGQLFFSRPTGKLAGIIYSQRQWRSVWFAKTYAVAQATVDKNFPDTNNLLVDCDLLEKNFLFRLINPQQPPRYVLLDLGARTLSAPLDMSPSLAHHSFQAVQPISFRTRDGVKLEGYLTLPAGASAERPVPLVVLPHGGPWIRDTLDFNPEVQFLASRGYAVLQPNYRGSSGYAPDISAENDFNYHRMHDDVTDATRAMLQLPLIDPKRVAIMGASFGGYLAIAGAELEDGIYCCALTTCGVFDWRELVDSKENQSPAAYAIMRDGLGQKPDQLSQISLLDHTDRIRIPVFIAHGNDDHTVAVEQSVALAAALKKRGIPHETFFRDLEGHGFYNYKNRVEYYHRVEAFLAAHLGGAPLASANPR